MVQLDRLYGDHHFCSAVRWCCWATSAWRPNAQWCADSTDFFNVRVGLTWDEAENEQSFFWRLNKLKKKEILYELYNSTFHKQQCCEIKSVHLHQWLRLNLPDTLSQELWPCWKKTQILSWSTSALLLSTRTRARRRTTTPKNYL